MKVYDLMSEQVISVGVSEPVSAAARLMKQYNIGAVPVCDSAGKLRGMITDRDITVRCTALGAAPDAKLYRRCAGNDRGVCVGRWPGLCSRQERSVNHAESK